MVIDGAKFNLGGIDGAKFGGIDGAKFNLGGIDGVFCGKVVLQSVLIIV